MTEGTIRLCVDEDCPACGWPERWAELTDGGPVFGCPKCDYTSRTRDG
jgi:hypothetical protein